MVGNRVGIGEDVGSGSGSTGCGDCVGVSTGSLTVGSGDVVGSGDWVGELTVGVSSGVGSGVGCGWTGSGLGAGCGDGSGVATGVGSTTGLWVRSADCVISGATVTDSLMVSETLGETLGDSVTAGGSVTTSTCIIGP